MLSSGTVGLRGGKGSKGGTDETVVEKKKMVQRLGGKENRGYYGAGRLGRDGAAGVGSCGRGGDKGKGEASCR